MNGKLLDRTECQILLDTGAKKIIYVQCMMQIFTFITQIFF